MIAFFEKEIILLNSSRLKNSPTTRNTVVVTSHKLDKKTLQTFEMTHISRQSRKRVKDKERDS